MMIHYTSPVRLILCCVWLWILPTTLSQRQPPQRPDTGTSATRRSIYDLISSDPENFLTFKTAVDLAGLEALYSDTSTGSSGEDDLTVFAPSNDAFGGVQGKYLEDDWQPALKALLLYHTVRGSYDSEALINKTAGTLTLPTLFSSNSLEVTEVDPIIINDQGLMIHGNLAVDDHSNSVVHILNSVLQPPHMDVSLLDQLKAASEYSRFYQLLTQLGLTDTLLDQDGPYTVLVPTDDAFNILLPLMDYLDDTELLAMALYHIVPSLAFTYDLSPDQTRTVTTLQGETLDLTMTGVLAKAEFVTNDNNLMASNGVLHAIDRMLLPSSTQISNIGTTTTNDPLKDQASIVPTTTLQPSIAMTIDVSETPSVVPLPSLLELVQQDDRLADLYSAIIVTDLDTTLQQSSVDYTLFAPTRDAFDAVPMKLLTDVQWNLHLTALLQYHLVPGTILTDDLSGNDTLTTTTTTATDSEITPLYVNGLDPVALNNDQASVVTPNLLARNGVLHVIDQLLLPPYVTRTLAEAINTNVIPKYDTSQFATYLLPSTSTSSLTLSQLDSSTEAFTVLAPINAAFLKEPIPVILKALSETDRHQILEYHILPGIVTGQQLTTSGARYTTLQGKDVVIMSAVVNNITQVRINNAAVLGTDVLCNNGMYPKFLLLFSTFHHSST